MDIVKEWSLGNFQWLSDCMNTKVIVIPVQVTRNVKATGCIQMWRCSLKNKTFLQFPDENVY